VKALISEFVKRYGWPARAISTAQELAVWIRALVGGEVLSASSQRQWLESPAPEDTSKPDGQKYGYGIAQISVGPIRLYFYDSEMPGYNSFMGHDPEQGEGGRDRYVMLSAQLLGILRSYWRMA
jgi:hypothetical protein